MPNLPSNFLDVSQNSVEWLIARTGHVTASRVKDVCKKLKSGKSSEARETYKYEVLTEVLTGRAIEHYVSEPMEFGLENEPLARANYEFKNDVLTERIGYVLHPHLPRTGASPDGLVGDEGLVEIKVPKTQTHLGYLLSAEVPEEYKHQMLWQMACTGRKWCDFISYDPRLPDEYNYFQIRFYRDEKAISEMELEVEKFISEINEMAEKLLAHKIKNAPPRNSALPRAEIPSFEDSHA